MKLHFLGAARSVTGSCYMLEVGAAQLLVDCGLRQGADAHSEYGEGFFPFDPGGVDCVILTHAHIDHAGLLPLLCKRGFRGKIYCTTATAQLSGIMLPDSGHIQEQEAEWHSRKRLRAGKTPVAPLYTAKDALDCVGQFCPVPYGELVKLDERVSVRFADAGHLLGSATIEFFIRENGRETKIVFSGDLGHSHHPIVQDPQPVRSADYVIMEATYGDRLHQDSQDPSGKERELADIIRDTFARGGNLVIPSFAVGRTQELLYMLKRLLRGELRDLGEVPVYIDSPLAIEATAIFEQCAQGYYDEEAMRLAKEGSLFRFDSLHVSRTVEDSKQINFDKRSKIIISSSGMCEAGRIKHHLKHNLWREDSTVLFVGYQGVGTTGRVILDGAKVVRLLGEEVTVRARIARIEGFSSHADQHELLNWLTAIRERKPKNVFLIHGEERALRTFERLAAQEGFSVQVPSLFESVDLEQGVAEMSHFTGAVVKRLVLATRVSREELMSQVARIGRLLNALEGREGEPETELKLKVLNADLVTFADKWEALLEQG